MNINPTTWPTYTPPASPATWLNDLHGKYCAWTCHSDDLDACWAAYHGIDRATPVTLEGFA